MSDDATGDGPTRSSSKRIAEHRGAARQGATRFVRQPPTDQGQQGRVIRARAHSHGRSVHESELTKNSPRVISQYRFVKFGSDDNHVVQAAAAMDLIIGATGILGASAVEDRVDVVMMGIVDMKAGGTITRGALVTADSSGQAVAAAPAAGVNNRVGGIALASAVSGDIIPVMLVQHQIQGA